MHAAGQKLEDFGTVNERVARFVAQQSRAAAPKRSGALARSIRGTAGRAKKRSSARISSNLIYAKVIHYGWPGHNIEPNPFIKQTIRSTRAQWLGAYRAETRKIVSKVRGE